MNFPELIKAKEIKPLYNFVHNHYPVRFQQRNESNWGAQIQHRNKKYNSLIVWSQTKHPKASLAHELLHIKNQILGYKRIKLGIAVDNNLLKSGYLKTVCDALDNEMQHHKMYAEYIELGLAPKEFYADSDDQTEEYIEDYLKNPANDFIQLSIQYLTLIAPGGSISEEKKTLLKNEFRKIKNGEFQSQFDEIDNLIIDYINDSSYDAEKYIIRFFQNLKCGRVWIGYKNADNFPSDGYFIGSPFDIHKNK